jgi:hypothetical protein
VYTKAWKSTLETNTFLDSTYYSITLVFPEAKKGGRKLVFTFYIGSQAPTTLKNIISKALNR